MRFHATHSIAVGASPDEVWQWVSRPRRWSELWPWVGLSVESASEELAAGDTVHASVPSPLGYRVRFALRVLEAAADERRVDVAVEGDVSGVGHLRLDGPNLSLEWDVEIRHRLLRIAWRVAEPALRWAHEQVVVRAADDLRDAVGAEPRAGRRRGRSVADVVVAAAVAGALAGVPSTVHALVQRRSVWDATRAAGALLGRPSAVRGLVAHSILSLFWAAVLSRLPVRRHPVVAGGAAGAVIGALDLGVVGRRIAEIRRLPQWPQVADHVAFGAIAGVVLDWRRR